MAHVILERPSTLIQICLSTVKARHYFDILSNGSALTDKSSGHPDPMSPPCLVSVPVLCILCIQVLTLHLQSIHRSGPCAGLKESGST